MTRLEHFQRNLRRISPDWDRSCRCFFSTQHHFGAGWLASSPKTRHSVRVRQFQVCHPQQVVGARHKVAPGLRPFLSPIPAPPESTDRLEPAKYLLHPFPDFQTNLVALLEGGASVQPSHVQVVLARDVGRNFPFPAALDKTFLVIRLVRSYRFDLHAAVKFCVGVGLLQRHHRFGVDDGVVQREVGAQAITVLHQDMSAKTQPGGLSVGLPIQHTFGIGRTVVRVIAPLFSTKADRGIAGVFIFGGLDFLVIGSVLADKALQARPRFNQRAVSGEVFIAGPAFLPAQVIDFEEEELGHVGGKDPVVVLGKDAVVEAAFGKLAVKEPEPEQIVAELFAEEAFTANTVEGGEHTSLEQLLRWDAGASHLLIKFLEQRRKLFKNRVHTALDSAQRMRLRHALVEVDHRQKVRLGLGFSTHDYLMRFTPSCSNSNETFSTAC